MNAKLKKSVEKFVAEYQSVIAEVYGGDETMALAEDVDTYYTLDVQVSSRGITYTTAYLGGNSYTEKETDEDEIKDLLKWWRAGMRKARRYFATDTETLDKISNGEIEDKDDEE